MNPLPKCLCAAVLSILSLCVERGWAAGPVVINEIHYDPPDRTSLEEFVELHNTSTEVVDLSGWYFAGGIDYTFPAGTRIDPGEFLVVALNPENLVKKFGLTRLLGPFEGYLSSEGERIVLRNARGGKEDEVGYDVGFPWPVDSAGDGSSMELIHPSLDNDLGGSWRASTGSRRLPLERTSIVPSQDPSWRMRKGTSEASTPPTAWRELGFVEDETWTTVQPVIGYADGDDKTVLDDMMNGYSTIYLRHKFTIDSPAEIPPELRLLLWIDDGAIVWINGKDAGRYKVSLGEKPYNAVAQVHEATRWEEMIIKNAPQFLRVGENVLAIHAINQNVANDDFSFDADLVIPARSELPPEPSPGLENSIYGENAPPQIRQVAPDTPQPKADEPFVINAKVTDPDGVAAVALRYQVVLPGKFIPAELALAAAELMSRPTQARKLNPAFEDPASWIEVAMADDGKGVDVTAADGIYSCAIPAQKTRTLVRYRIRAADTKGLSVDVPYADDPSLNFACFVYSGVPPYKTTRLTVHPEGVGFEYPAEALTKAPVYFLIARSQEITECIGYNGAFQIPKGNEAARDAFNWEGAFVYEDKVYDHIHFRLRQANDRYGGAGKRSWRFRFNKGNHLEARDMQGRRYPTRWRTLNTGKMFDNKGVGNFGLTEALNEFLWNTAGAPAPFSHLFHFRVVKDLDEAPANATGQHLGDFWGMALALEDYDPRFLDAHGLEDGNLYKLKDGVFTGNDLKRNQGRFGLKTDADFQNIRANLRSNRPVAWLDQHVNYEQWYPYHTVVEAIRHYDFVPADSHSKNRAWYFEPAEGSPMGRLWTLPWDADASWGPNWNDGIDYSTQAISAGTDKAPFRIAYRNFIREFRDLLWREEDIHALIDELAAPIVELAKADRDRWRGAPATAGSQDFGTMEAKIVDMKRFAFVTWSGPSGPTVPAGGRAKHLDNLSIAEGDAAAIPKTPIVMSKSPAGFPIDELVFETSPFSDAQGEGTFAALKWRVAEVTDPKAPAFDPEKPRILEWNAVWESDELTAFSAEVRIPLGRVLPGHTYRTRAKMKDTTGRWSHWSAPVEFAAAPPLKPIAQQASLRITELMYNPLDGGDIEFVELQNIGDAAVDLRGVRFDGGIDFEFSGGAVTSLGPGEFVVVVKNRSAFESSYDASGIKIAGEFEGKLDNGGDEVRLYFGEELGILIFEYDDAWHPTTDGQGYSLVVADARAPVDRWSLLTGWKPSAEIGGSPGRAEGGSGGGGRQIVGDLNQDAKLDITDPIVLLGHLFLSTPVPLPCGDSLDAPGNRALLDMNGDRLIDLSDAVYGLNYLFLGGAPPSLGTGCVRIEGCPNSCTP